MFWLRQYTLPLLLALGLHAAAGWALYSGWTPEKDTTTVIKPRMIMANLMVLEPKAAPAKVKAPPPQPKKTPPAKTQPAEKPKVDNKKIDEAEAARKRAEAEAKRRADEQARKEREQAERLERLSQLAEASFEDALADESEALQAGTAEQVAQSYQFGIYELVRQNWSRPPSARNGMSARLLVELIPTGEVSSVSVVESSGNAAFDRSAEQAVRQARRFEVPDDNAIFEAHFRKFYFLFQPEDLLR